MMNKKGKDDVRLLSVKECALSAQGRAGRSTHLCRVMPVFIPGLGAHGGCPFLKDLELIQLIDSEKSLKPPEC